MFHQALVRSSTSERSPTGLEPCKIDVPGCVRRDHAAWLNLDIDLMLVSIDLRILTQLCCCPCFRTWNETRPTEPWTHFTVTPSDKKISSTFSPFFDTHLYLVRVEIWPESAAGTNMAFSLSSGLLQSQVFTLNWDHSHIEERLNSWTLNNHLYTHTTLEHASILCAPLLSMYTRCYILEPKPTAQQQSYVILATLENIMFCWYKSFSSRSTYSSSSYFRDWEVISNM